MTEQNLEAANWRRIALPASLVLNLFLIAVIGGHVWRSYGDRGDSSSTPLTRALAAAEANLSARDAAAFRAVMQRDAPDFATAGQELTAARRNLERQITAEPFDREAVKQALVAWRASWILFTDKFGGTLVEAVAQVSPEGRSRLVAGRREAEKLHPEKP
jgi:uncharacterized membrane protein